ncbi:hybrid sensor histidine kinase/response regulator [Limibacter armeniacum]|uniref:hybrid sensor histidine kinase/response regulator n=1 Tax=Limibacter armeniacum TaxID=466084 RepID=UPI002FE6167A
MKLLYIEDSLPDFKLLQSRLRKASEDGFEITHVTSLKQAKEAIQEYSFDLLLLDLSLPDAHGLEGLADLKSSFPLLPVVVLTGNTDKTVGLEAIRNGAQDYLVKGDFSVELFSRVCNYAVQRFNINQELKNALTALKEEKELVEQKNQQINAFVSLLAHDLKNPVSTISMLTNVLLNTKGMDDKQVQYLNQIQRSSDSMLDHILSIMETTQVHRGELVTNLVADTPYYTLNAAIDPFVLEAIQQNIILDIQYSKVLPTVTFDKKFLHNVLTRLLEFILRQLAANSRIVIGAVEENKVLKITLDAKGLAYNMDEILDFMGNYNPVSTQATDQELMEEFQLSVVKQQVVAMRGKIGAEPNATGRGTVFWFTLPLAGEAQRG